MMEFGDPVVPQGIQMRELPPDGVIELRIPSGFTSFEFWQRAAAEDIHFRIVEHPGGSLVMVEVPR